MKLKSRYLSLISLLIFFNVTIINSRIIVAQTEVINPLEITEKDPFLPSIDRPLSEFEIKRLKKELVKLDQEANTELKAGNIDKAFEIWYRESRLTRVLGVEEELKSLIKLSKIAWGKERSQDINNIQKRLLVLEIENKDNQGQIKSELLEFFASAYEELHNLNKSLELYELILKLAREKQDTNQIKLGLQKVGKIYLARFNYYQAEPIYNELLIIAQKEEDFLNEGIYLRKLAEINGQIAKPENAINYKKALIENNVKNQNLQPLADLNISIGDDYKTLNKSEEASKYYQEAFNLAWAAQQLATAGEALKKLAKLYQDYKQNDYALQIYNELIKVEQKSYNLYGLMNAYDQIGQIYLEQKNTVAAIQWFKKALEIANHLSYKVDYFQNKITQIDKEQLTD